jgi:hypothetical protein
LRLGEKEFVDLMNQTLFMKREHEKWSQIKVLRNLDVDRLRASSDSKIVTHHDWMVSALLALNK